jgi:hypothetical protein
MVRSALLLFSTFRAFLLSAPTQPKPPQETVVCTPRLSAEDMSAFKIAKTFEAA